jgi:glycosyltransferase involved in cell wall biosynthesis
MQVSIIVPVFNEAPLIRPFLSNLRERTRGAEIIVVDGASTDGTDRLAQGLCDHVIRSGERSRAKQMNVGADVAGGDIFWFLHADAEVPLESLNEIGRIMRNPEVCGGFFRIRMPAVPAVYRLTDGFAHYAGLLLRMRCGDHGMFCRRTAFVDAGGFPDVPLMEDVEFFRRLRRCGRVAKNELGRAHGVMKQSDRHASHLPTDQLRRSIFSAFLYLRLPDSTAARVVADTSRCFFPSSGNGSRCE